MLAAVVGCSADGSDGRGGGGSTSAAPSPGERGAAALVDAACDRDLERSAGPQITDPALAEVSGVAPTSGRTWVHNDSGDGPRIFGVAADGSAQEVAVGGAEAVDWEDITVVGEHLWIADTGDNARKRASVQLYRVPIPGEGQVSVQAERVDVTYPDGSHDVEAVAADPSDGSLYLLTKLELPTLLFRVVPPDGAGAAEAEPLGRVPIGGTRIATSMAIAPDRAAVAVRTYDGAWLQPIAPEQPIADALVDADARCRAPAGLEIQGEAIGFLADSTGYVTIGEGAEPRITTFTAPP